MQLRKNCLIGARVASELFGTESPIGKYVQANNIYYRIVGVVRPRNDNVNIGGNMEEMLMLPLAVMRQNYNLGEKYITSHSLYVTDVLPVNCAVV